MFQRQERIGHIYQSNLKAEVSEILGLRDESKREQRKEKTGGKGILREILYKHHGFPERTKCFLDLP